MEQSEILTMLTREDSEAVRKAIIGSTQDGELIRRLDHENWKVREERKMDSRMRLDTQYIQHVKECNWHNRVTTVALIAVLAFLTKALIV